MRRPPYHYVDMIRSHIALYYIHLMFRAYVFDDDPRPKPNIFFQNSVTIFGLPYKVILKIGNSMCPSPVTFLLHCVALQIGYWRTLYSQSPCAGNYLLKTFPPKRRRFIPCPFEINKTDLTGQAAQENIFTAFYNSAHR